MSAAIACDVCNTTLLVDARGDDEMGERAAWIRIVAGGLTWDMCSRSCALLALDDGTRLSLAVDAQLEVVTEIARTIREDRELGGNQ